MNRKPLIPLAFLALAGLLFSLNHVVPPAYYPVFETLRLGGRLPNRGGGPDVRAKAELPVPRRYIEACRDQATRRMAQPDWPSLDRQGREEALARELALCGADAEYWSMSEAHQKRVAHEFAAAFLDAPPAGAPGASVDK